MTNKLTSRRFSWVVVLLLLAACAPVQPSIPEIQTKAVVTAQTSIALTQTAWATATPPLPTVTPTATAIFVFFTPTPAPSSSISIMTPDAYQVEHWREFQAELAKVLLAGYSPDLGYPPDLYKHALCEWDILGRSDQKMYVWAFCALSGGGGSGDSPAVIYLGENESIQNVKVPFRDSKWEIRVQEMFPVEVREKFSFYIGNSLFYGRIKEMIDHIDYREAHPEEPPMVVLSSSLATTPTP
jgi:hypothetical protein